MSLADYGQWILAACGVTTAWFVFVATFLEFSGRRILGVRSLRFRGIKAVRFRYFRWWRHELTAAQVILDLCLTVVLLPTSLYILFKVNILSLSSNSTTSMWYYAIGFTAVALATLWRADVTMRAKGKERNRMEAEKAREEPRENPAAPE